MVNKNMEYGRLELKRCVIFLADLTRPNEISKVALCTADFVVPCKKVTKSFHS